MKISHVEGAILAGGESSRMGRDKATAELHGRPLVRHVADALGACLEKVSVVVRPGDAAPLDLPCIEDTAEVRAPLAGVHAALAACTRNAVLIAGCDMPRVEPRLVLALLALAPARWAEGDPQVIAPQSARGTEPLLAIYRPTLLPEIERRIAAGTLSLHGLLDDVNTLRIPKADVRVFDPDLVSFLNVNREADLAALR